MWHRQTTGERAYSDCFPKLPKEPWTWQGIVELSVTLLGLIGIIMMAYRASNGW